MKKSGILNPYIMQGLTSLGHLDSVVICDAGFPIPKEANYVDISLIAGIPDFLQVLQAVLNEIIIEEYVVFDFMQKYNPKYYNEVQRLFKKQRVVECSMDDFRVRADAAKLFIRTGELLPASNIILVSASGVDFVCKELDIKV
jgi:D-ribose pyranase